MNLFSFEMFQNLLIINLFLKQLMEQCLQEFQKPFILYFQVIKKNEQDNVNFGSIFQNSIQNKFQRNMQQTFKSPRCRKPHPYKKVTVVPIDFGNPTFSQPALQTRSSRSNSKTKIRLVSPMKKLNQTAFMSKNNQPINLIETQKSVMSPKNTVQIELGGRNASNNKENTLQTNQKLSKSNYNNPYLQSSQHIIQKVHTSPFVQVHQAIPPPFQSQSKMSSPNKSIHIKYTPTPFIINHKTTSSCAENIPSITFMHVRRNSNDINIPQVKPNFPTELQICEGDVIEQLKESYECELNDIKRLKQEIEQNNQEIKKLLKSSRASKEITKSKTLLEQPIERQIVHFQDESVKNIASIENLRLIKCQKEDNQIQLLDCQRKDKAIGSKKTLINSLYFQTQEKLENLAKYNKSVLQNEAVQTQEITLPVLSKHSTSEAKSSQRQLKLTLNNVCQVQCVGSSSSNLVSQPITLQDSIICQKQEVIKVQSKKQLKQQPKNKSNQKLHNVQNISQLKKQSLKMISSIKSLTKVVYESDIEQKQSMHQSKTSLNKIQVDDQLDNILPVSQKSIKIEKQKQQISIPLVVQTKKSELKVPEIKFQTKENSVMDKQANKTWYQNHKVQQLKITIKEEIQHPKSTLVNNKKGRKINNSIYL